MKAIDINNPTEIRTIGIKALKEALGYVGMVRFIQQYDRGHGDYTKEKQQDGTDITYDDLEPFLKRK